MKIYLRIDLILTIYLLKPRKWKNPALPKSGAQNFKRKLFQWNFDTIFRNERIWIYPPICTEKLCQSGKEYAFTVKIEGEIAVLFMSISIFFYIYLIEIYENFHLFANNIIFRKCIIFIYQTNSLKICRFVNKHHKPMAFVITSEIS